MQVPARKKVRYGTVLLHSLRHIPVGTVYGTGSKVTGIGIKVPYLPYIIFALAESATEPPI